jgi:malonyl-CoA O-methyltransferase
MSPADAFGLPQQAMMRRRFERAAASFDSGADAVHAEARIRLAERLLLLGAAPEVIVDLGTATGQGAALLGERYPAATILAADSSLAMLGRARRLATATRAALPVLCDAHRLPCADATVDLIFANLLLPWTRPDVVFAECARVLRPGGLALFTTVGPDTLVELRRAWVDVDEHVHVHGFVDLHDLGDLALRAGLAEPVVDVDRLTLSYRDVTGLIADLRMTGAANSALGRCEGLMGRRRWQAFEAALGAGAQGGRLEITVELVFVQGWGADRRRPGAVSGSDDGVVRIPAASLVGRRGAPDSGAS